MGKRVKIRALVSEAGPDRAWTAGSVIEVGEDEAKARIADGRAEPVDASEERVAVNRAGQPLETAAVAPPEVRSHSDQAIDGVNAFVDAGLSEAQAEALIAAGYADLDAARAATDEELAEIDGIGPATVKKIKGA